MKISYGFIFLASLLSLLVWCTQPSFAAQGDDVQGKDVASNTDSITVRTGKPAVSSDLTSDNTGSHRSDQATEWRPKTRSKRVLLDSSNKPTHSSLHRQNELCSHPNTHIALAQRSLAAHLFASGIKIVWENFDIVAASEVASQTQQELWQNISGTARTLPPGRPKQSTTTIIVYGAFKVLFRVVQPAMADIGQELGIPWDTVEEFAYQIATMAEFIVLGGFRVLLWSADWVLWIVQEIGGEQNAVTVP